MEETPPKLFVNYIKKYCPLFARKVKGHTKMLVIPYPYSSQKILLVHL
jgi:hypothetical protein